MSMGSSRRCSFFDGKKDSTDPGLYTLSSSFDLKHQRKGPIFGDSREKVKANNYLYKGEKTPAPTVYNPKKETFNSLMYSMRVRTAYPKTCRNGIKQILSPMTRR